MLDHRDDHQDSESAIIQCRNGPQRLGKHGDIDGPKGDAGHQIGQEGHLLHQARETGAPPLDDGIAQQDADHGRDDSCQHREPDTVPGGLEDHRVAQ